MTAAPRTAGALALALAAGVAGAAGFVDPLDRAAERSALAVRAPLSGVARAGERLVAVGQRGHVLWSDDAGASWAQASVPVAADLTAVRFASTRGLAVGHDGVVLATADGGRTWRKQLDARALGPLPLPSLLDVWIDEDGRTGFAVGAFDLVLFTGDGGATWTRWLDRTDNPRRLHLHAIARAAGDLWIAGEQGLLLKLDRGAGRFRAVRLPYGGSLFGITGDERTVLAFGLRGNAFRSDDRGATWEKVDTGVDESLHGATIAPDGRMVLVTLGGRILASADGGRCFRAAGRARGAPISAIVAVPADGAIALVVVGAGGARVEKLR